MKTVYSKPKLNDNIKNALNLLQNRLKILKSE